MWESEWQALAYFCKVAFRILLAVRFYADFSFSFDFADFVIIYGVSF